MSITPSQALNEHNVDLLKHLPLDSTTFFEMAKNAGLFPLDTGDNIKAKPTRADKVSYFLSVIGPGADSYLPKLLKVMKDSGVDDVVQLAEKIAKAIGMDSTQSKLGSGSSKPDSGPQPMSGPGNSSGFDCSKAAGVLRDNHAKLSNLSYTAMRAQLFAYEVITHQERMQIDTLIGNAQMEQVLDIVRVSLKDNQTTKYKGFLKAMEEDEDILLKKAAEDLERNMAAKLSPRDAVIKFGVRLLKEFPLENLIVLDMVHDAGLLPLDYKSAIKAKDTRSEKVAFFKEKVLGTEAAANMHLPKLLDVMDNCEDLAAIALAKDIREATGLIKSNPDQTPPAKPTPPKGEEPEKSGPGESSSVESTQPPGGEHVKVSPMPISPSQALKKYSVKLLTHLPLENAGFFAMAQSAGLFPLGTDDSIKAEPTRAKKVISFLSFIASKADSYLKILLKVMKDSDAPCVVQLADEIAVATGMDGQRNPSVKMQTFSSRVKLFISYVREEATNAFVVKLKRDLEATGLQVFLDGHDIILPGDNIQHELAEGIDGIIIIYSERCPTSNWCQNELHMAQRLNIPIFPVRRISGPCQGNVDLALEGISYTNFNLDNEDEYQESLGLLIKEIEENCVKK